MSIPEDIAAEQRSLESTYGRTFIVRHHNTFDNPTTWAFADYGEAAKLRDKLNTDANGEGVDGRYHVEEEPHYPSADAAIADLREQGWFED